MSDVKAIVTIVDAKTERVIFANQIIEPTDEEYIPELQTHKYRFDFRFAKSDSALIYPTILPQKQRK